MRFALPLAAVVCAVIVAVWAWLGQPVPMPATPLAAGEKMPCVSYAPFRPGQSPFVEGLVIPPEQIDDDFARLAKITHCVRTYSTEMGLDVVPAMARKHGLKVLQGIWIGRNEEKNRVEIDAAVKAAQENPDVIDAIIVGNEVLLRGEQSPTGMAALIREVKSKVPVPVTYADVWEFWERNRDLAQYVDFVTVHILPFWEDVPVAADKSAAHIGEIREHVGKVFAGKDILIGETGWPSEGRMREGALPSPSNQAMVIQELLALAKDKGYRINVIEAFDQPWKRASEGTVGGHWGFLDAYTRDFKFGWGEAVSDHPYWLRQALIGVLLALGVFAAGAFGGRAGNMDTRRWLAVSGIGLFAGLTIGRAFVSVPVESLGAGGWIRGGSILALAVLVPLAAAFAVGRQARAAALTQALDGVSRRAAAPVERVMAILLAASVVVIAHVALGLVFDPRYKDFQFAGLTPVIMAFAFYALTAAPRVTAEASAAEKITAAIFLGSGLYIVFNETLANWQGLWTGVLLVVMALSLWRLATAAQTR
ncbi:beta-1,6-glucan synthase [Ancylobacter sp. Lp-2]|uniref:glycoside hydrolase family 17 protein n=1 Tax=Ancylobacter sp. Lp-2 TaxID=2881339 RepID=UPI001E44BAF7|nr:beta-1,6-glucan synthase [Ancylobacter sp. Lp-2]MCB4768263.1 beta-1,6-glucan synthase [Ancylobacter sp. Lp-2]